MENGAGGVLGGGGSGTERGTVAGSEGVPVGQVLLRGRCPLESHKLTVWFPPTTWQGTPVCEESHDFSPHSCLREQRPFWRS